MRLSRAPLSAAPPRGARPRLSVGPVYDRVAGQVVHAGVLALGDGLVVPRPFWHLLQQLALHADWLRATFALTTRPTCYGVAQADGDGPVTGFCGTWLTSPRLTLVVAGQRLSEAQLRASLLPCLRQKPSDRADDPFPPWQPGDPWSSLGREASC
jgi:hypothetical protein